MFSKNMCSGEKKVGFEITVIEKFSAAHFLRGYEGDCARVHGHNYSVEVTVYAEKLNELGLVMDFRDLKKILREIIQNLDHQLLNDLDVFSKESPSAENIALYIHTVLKGKLPSSVKLKSVSVWETESSKATYRED